MRRKNTIVCKHMNKWRRIVPPPALHVLWVRRFNSVMMIMMIRRTYYLLKSWSKLKIIRNHMDLLHYLSSRHSKLNGSQQPYKTQEGIEKERKTQATNHVYTECFCKKKLLNIVLDFLTFCTNFIMQELFEQ